MKAKHNPLLARIALAIPEQRRELGLSLAQLGRLSQVSPATVSKVEHGGRIDPTLLLRIASVMATIELYAPQKPAEDVVDDLSPSSWIPLFEMTTPNGATT